jgi:hypothetical protein
MAKDKISDYSATANSNTDIAGINIDEGCAPSGINDAIRTLMKQLKDFQQGTQGDSFNGPHNGTVGATTPASGAFTTLSASSTLSVTGAGTIQGLTVGKGAGAVSTNTAVGASALAANTSGTFSTAVGYEAGKANTNGYSITAVGARAGWVVNGAANFTAVGTDSGRTSTTAASASFFGANSGFSNTTGSYLVAVGDGALYSNTTASNNTAVGYQAGYSATTNGYNTFVGQTAGYSTTGVGNTFIGCTNASVGAGYFVTTGTKNTIIGGFHGNQGGLDIRTASNYIVLSDGDGNPRQIINNSGYLFYYTMASGAGTNALKFNTSTGAVTYDTSSARYKDNIRDSIYGLSHVMQMRSAQFEYKDTGRSDVGLIAEELQPIIPELVGTNKEGQADSVSYDRMVSVLVKAIQELKAEFDAYKEAHP